MFLAIGVWQAVIIGALIFGIFFLSAVIAIVKKNQKKQ